jgi:electron transfer flavoprotein alpha subunit
MTVLVVAEHEGGVLNPSTLSTVGAAAQIGGGVDILVAGGDGSPAVANAAGQIQGVGKVLLAQDAAYTHFLPENMAPLVQSVAGGYSHVLAPATTFGKDFMPRVAALLDVAQVSDIIAVESADTFKRPIYAGNAIATVKSTDGVKVITVRPTAFDKVAAEGGSAAVENVESKGDAGLSAFVKMDATESDRPDLATANIVVSGGRGFGDKEKFNSMLESLASKLGAAIGASRAAVDSGFCPNDYQVGQTGKVVAPDLYIAIGISGAIQHLAGMKESKVIVAINNDENAPIFEIADYGLVADLFEALPEIESAL